MVQHHHHHHRRERVRQTQHQPQRPLEITQTFNIHVVAIRSAFVRYSFDRHVTFLPLFTLSLSRRQPSEKFAFEHFFRFVAIFYCVFSFNNTTDIVTIRHFYISIVFVRCLPLNRLSNRRKIRDIKNMLNLKNSVRVLLLTK